MMMNKIKKLTAFLLAAAMIFSVSVFSFAHADANHEDGIRFGEDGKFRIMHVTDTHLEEDNLEASVWAIGEACDAEKPDIVMITGDNVQNCENPEDTKHLIDGLMNVFESRDIPVAVTFGNHDSEGGAMSREELMAYYNTFSCSVSVDDGDSLPGCGTYNIPVLSADGEKIRFNLWVFDSGDYDENGHYGCVLAEQVEWYKETSAALTASNNGEKVYSLVFQHIIVPEVYDALEKCGGKTLFAFEHIYNEGEYYRFNPENRNFGTLNETPCSGYLNFGQFDAMAENGDVLAMFTGHDHTNAFGVRHKGIDIVNSLSTRYNGDRYSTQYGYRIIDVDESDTSVYTSRSVHWYDFFDLEYAFAEKQNGDDFGFETALDITVRGFFQKAINTVYRGFASIVTGRQVTYAD